MKAPSLKLILTGLVALSMAATASAQYVWLDEKGVKQFSDTPPPATVPKNRILKEPAAAPRSSPRTAPEAASGQGEKAAAGASASASVKAPMTTAEKNADFQKRRNEQADKEKKAAEQERQAADKRKNCDRARAYSRDLESGQRMVRTDSNGERSFLTDEQRAHEVRETKRAIDECK